MIDPAMVGDSDLIYNTPMSHPLLPQKKASLDASAIPICPLQSAQLDAHLKKRETASTARWVHAQGFEAKTGSICLIPSAKGDLERVLLGVDNLEDGQAFADLSCLLPSGRYYIEDAFFKDDKACFRATLAFGLGAYRFDRYQRASSGPPDQNNVQLYVSTRCSFESLEHWLTAWYLARDLINTPANICTPSYLAQHAERLAKQHGAQLTVLSGSELKSDYPTVYAVGQAGQYLPCVIDLRWGAPDALKLTLVGKGVCFDTGGLNLKPGSSMRLMKKDMGGAAHALAFASLIMAHQLPICLRVLVPAVENAVSANSYRPGDIIKTAAAIHVEIDNTDAEGRLILADALHHAKADQPDYLIDFATLTGAARVALGWGYRTVFYQWRGLVRTIVQRR